jgi:hypothetical protein
VTFQTECPVLQQNTVLCDDSVMICCLPAEDAGFVPEGPDTGSGSGGGDSGGGGPTDAPPDSAGD